MSKNIANLLYSTVRAVTAPMSKRQRAKTLARVADKLRDQNTQIISTPHGDLKFLAGHGHSVASAIARFHDDEPETLRYIDEIIKPGETLWDIGANIGIYSLYAAKRGAHVVAFEPSAFNFGLLVEHIRINHLSANIKPLCLALSDGNGLADLYMAEVTAGHASNSIGVAANQNKSYTPAFTQSVVAMTGDQFASQFSSTPDHIKLDVDGLEPVILRHMPETLSKAKSVLIEIEGNNADNADILAALTRAGLREDTNFSSRSGRNRLFVR
jgi:FkbM family methyltransferase